MKPLILLTNDDEVYSQGLSAAASVARCFGDILVVAPRYQQTSMSRSFPINENNGIIEDCFINFADTDIKAYGVSGSPALAVSHGLLELCERKPDLCISGINLGENVGLCIGCSGTLGAAFEANTYGIPSVAFSVEVPIQDIHNLNAKVNWPLAIQIMKKTLAKIFEEKLITKIDILNINIPDSANINTTIKLTHQGNKNCFKFIKPEKRNFSKPYRLKSALDIEDLEYYKNTDVYAFYHEKIISVTPLTWDFSTELSVEGW